MQINNWWVALGVGWTVIFAAMSFYWAMGGNAWSSIPRRNDSRDVSQSGTFLYSDGMVDWLCEAGGSCIADVAACSMETLCNCYDTILYDENSRNLFIFIRPVELYNYFHECTIYFKYGTGGLCNLLEIGLLGAVLDDWRDMLLLFD